MGSINLYKIDNSRIQQFYTELSEKLNFVKTIVIDRKNGKENTKFEFALYSFIPNTTKELKWNWIFKLFDEPDIKSTSSPKAVLLVKKDEDHVYAITFGYSFFLVDKFAEKDFGFTFARKILFDEIKTTTLTIPNSKRNKMVNTYVNYDNLEFDSGESFAKLKARAKFDNDFSLFKPSLEIGTSIRLVIEENTFDRIIDIICYIENIIQTEEDKYKIPVFSKIKDAEQINNLNERMRTSVKDSPDVSISELDIIGSTEVFNRNDSEFVLKYKRKEKSVISLSNDELHLFCEENNFDFGESVLDISVYSLFEGEPINHSLIRNLIDFTDDEERCLLSKGSWYQYNDDYLNYLEDSIYEIKAEYHPEFDFNDEKHNKVIDLVFNEEKNNEVYSGKTNKEIHSMLKKKYYAERAFNMLMECDYEFQNFDRYIEYLDGNKVEPMDLYKDRTMYAVKFGNSSAKLCYAVDQSIASLKAYKHKQLKNMPEIDTVAIWLVLERETHIEGDDGVPNINDLDMLMLKNRLDQWKKEVRLQGLKPLIYVNYKK